MSWAPMLVLPNVQISRSIEADPAALVPTSDRRITALCRKHDRLRRFLSRFSDQFGGRVSPTVALLRSDASPQFWEVDAIASVRDLVALVVIAYNRALTIKRPHGDRIHFANAFEFYPWMIDKNYEDLVGKTPALLGVHDVMRFNGQTSPAMGSMRMDHASLDNALLTELIGRWRKRYESANPSLPDLALFRSLNMAYHASMLPAGTDTTFYDVGRLIALWVSAFEILIHPGGNGQANRDKVFDLIEHAPWQLPASGDRNYETGGKKQKRTAASWLYQQLYEQRCAFLHGNPVRPEDLLLPISRRIAFQFAAPLFRMALTSFLPLTYTRKAPPISDAKAFGAYVADRMSFNEPQREIEEALLLGVLPIGTQAARRTPRARPTASVP